MLTEAGVAVVGAGPYGLSIAAHLKHAGVDVVTIGSTMASWRQHMPRGMQLKSGGFASNLSEPTDGFTLEQFCHEHQYEYHPWQWPVPLAVFSDYGVEFQRRFVPEVREDTVERLDRTENRFVIDLRGGDTIICGQVVLATGLLPFTRVPSILQDTPTDLWSHSSFFTEPSAWKRQRVAVVGAGSSAVDLAVLLHEAEAEPLLVCRREHLEFGDPRVEEKRSLYERLRRPLTPLGTGWRNLLATELPLVFHTLPAPKRTRIVATHLGPAAGWFMRERAKPIPTRCGYTVSRIHPSRQGLRLTLKDPKGGEETHNVDHLVAATGYDVDLRRLRFLHPDLLSRITTFDGKPQLSRWFESSVPGLYFAGPMAANSFGPLLRFVAGAPFTASRVAAAISVIYRKRRSGNTVSLGRPS